MPLASVVMKRKQSNPTTAAKVSLNASKSHKMEEITHAKVPFLVPELWEMVMDREPWRAAIHGVAKSGTRLSD